MDATRLLLACWWVALAASARAQQAELVVLLDLDRDPATGCAHATAEGVVTGAELRLRTQVDAGLAQVVSATRAACANAETDEFAPELPLAGLVGAPWAVVPGDGTSGSTLIETYLPLGALQGSTLAHASVALDAAAGADALLTTSGAGGGEPIALALGASAVPALAGFALALLAAALAAALALASSRAARRAALAAALCASVALPFSVRAGLGDGVLRAWSASERVATDPSGDAPEGADILAAFAHTDEEAGVLLIRVDALLGPAQCLAWPTVDPGSGYPCNQEPPPDPGPFASRVALTFDDGPNLATTPSIVATLRAESVPATFFMMGEALATPAARALALEIHADPLFEVANHSFSHPSFPTLTAAQMRAQIASTNDALQLALGDCFYPRFFRLPFGASNCTAAGVIREYGLSLVGVHADSLDWCYALGGGFCPPSAVPGLAAQYRNDMVAWVRAKLAETGGGIVLMHDIHANTAAQLPGLIAALRADGASFVPLDDASAFPLVNAAVNPPEPPACCPF